MSCADCGYWQAEAADRLRQLMEVVGGVQSTLTFIDNELDEPTMPRRDFIPAIEARLGATLNSAY